MSIGPPPEPVEVVVRNHHAHAWNKRDISAGIAGAVAASRQVMAGSDVSQLGGWSIRETTGLAGATFRFHDGHDNNGEVLCNCNLAANESVRDMYGPHGIKVATGRVWIEIVSGSVEGVIYWR